METSTIRNIYYLFIIALLVTSDFSYAMGMRQREEPQCNSRFDYEYKVLQKLLELETSQKELQETIKIQQDTIAAQGDTLKDYERSLKETTSSLDEAMVKINETGRELKETVSSLGDARTKINESKHKDMAGKHILIF